MDCAVSTFAPTTLKRSGEQPPTTAPFNGGVSNGLLIHGLYYEYLCLSVRIITPGDSDHLDNIHMKIGQ